MTDQRTSARPAFAPPASALLRGCRMAARAARTVFCLGFLCAATLAQTPTFPQPNWFHEVISKSQSPGQLPGPEHLRDYVVDGKLRLTLEQAIQLALVNDPDFHIDELSYQNSRFAILRAYAPFDPFLANTFVASRAITPTSNQLISGAQTLSSNSESLDFFYSQLFLTGTSVSVEVNGARNANNDIYNTFNPYIQSFLTLSASQPLLRNCCTFINRAPILIARLNMRQQRAGFEVQIANLISNVVNLYWNVVQADQSLVVNRKSLDEAQTTYDHDKRELELGGLAPGDIYRSEAEVATRRVQVIQSEYAVKEAQDALRRMLGADLDSNIAAMDLDLIEPAEPTGQLVSIDAATAIEQAMAHRPELDGLRQQLAADDINIRLAHNELEPSLNLSGFYTSNGLGGDAIDTSVSPPVVISTAGLAASLGQLGSFKYPDYGLTLRLGLPIRNRQAEADYGSSQVSKQRDLYSVEQAQENVRLDALNAVHNLEQAKLTMEAARVALDFEQKTLQSEQRKYNLGVGTLFILLQTQTDLATAETNLVGAQINYQRALVALDYATGQLLDRHHVIIRDRP
jgi:outer membrane protein